MSFASDIDLGYCLNPMGLHPFDQELVKHMVVRIEALLNGSKLETAHQYFEINEDLSRFTDPETLHTISSILESRLLIGNVGLFEKLKQQFYEILPYEAYVVLKLSEYRRQKRPSLSSMDMKEDYGGLRSLQIPLWLTATTYGVFPHQTAELLALLLEKQILSVYQGYALSQALEFLYDLRNFSGTARKFHYDEEAQHSGCNPNDLIPNHINDNLEKLYLLKKRRFIQVDEFDRYRLRMVQSVQELSRLILRRLLEKTIVHTFERFQLVAHLRKIRILEIHAVQGLPHVPLTVVFHQPDTILDLFIYIGESSYGLSFELKDKLSSIVSMLTPHAIEEHHVVIQQKFTRLLLTPYAAKALTTMFEIVSPSDSNQPIDTLIGRFIPELNQIRFLLRNLNYHQHPVCTHSLKALQNTQEELQYLKKNYPELYQLLEPRHILALKWGVLFHDIGKIDPSSQHEVSGTSIAVNALKRLGYDDEELFKWVSLLILHHMTVVRLSKTSTYLDQAIQTFFNIAERDMVQVILLFLTNISDYGAVSESTAKETGVVRSFFDQTYQIFSEMRIASQKTDPLELINLYLLNKKRDLESDTRTNLLIHKSLQNDLDTALLEPLKEIQETEYQKLLLSQEEIRTSWKYLKLGSLDYDGTRQYTTRLLRCVRGTVSESSIKQLTHDFDQVFEWFFAVAPNRFLLDQDPSILSQKLLEFMDLQKKLIVSVLTNPRGRVSGILIYAENRKELYTRIAYAIGQKKLNIVSGKTNQVQYADGKIGFFSYFQVANSHEIIFPRELERIILQEKLPKLEPPSRSKTLHTPRGLKLHFLGDDGKGYHVIERDGHFIRESQNYVVVKITAEDAPQIYYKISEVFDHVKITIQQTLITTTGHHVSDYFYITPEEGEVLKHSDFEERLKLWFLG